MSHRKSITSEAESQLIEQARRDEAAFACLYEHYFPRVYRYVSSRMGREQDAEDVVSAVFLQVAVNLHRFEWRHEVSFAAWLFRIAHNLVSNFHRRHKARPEVVPLEAVPSLRAREGLPEEDVQRKELFSHLYCLIQRLPPRRQEVVTLRFFAGLRNNEIAQVVGLDERTVASHLARALKQLHEMYQEASAHARESIGP